MSLGLNDSLGIPRKDIGFQRVRVLGYAGYGSLSTCKVQTFTQLAADCFGDQIIWNKDTVNGDTFTIGVSGLYQVTIDVVDGGSSVACGPSIDPGNQVDVTVAVNSLADSNRRGGYTQTTAGAKSNFSNIFPVFKGEKIRFHTGGTSLSSSTNHSFSITLINKFGTN